MSNQNVTLSKDQVSLDDLKRAIAAVPALSTKVRAFVYQTRRADAWRTAFEWREGLIHRHMTILHADALKAWIAERDEGIALIREKLQS